MTVARVHAGQVWSPLPAGQHNEIAEATNWANAQRLGETFDRGRRQRDYDAILLSNESGLAIARGEVLAIAGPLLTTEPADEPQQYAGRPIHRGTTPYTYPGPTRQCVVVADEEIPADSGSIGRFIASGLAVAKVNVHATWHRRAYPMSSDRVLHSGLFGPCEILSTLSTTGEQMVLVSVGHADNRTVFAESRGIAAASYDATNGVLHLGSGTAKILAHCGTDNFGKPEYCRQSQSLTVYNPTCLPIGKSDPVILTPGDDWLPLAFFLCEVKSVSSEPPSSESSESESESSSESNESSSVPSESSPPSESASEPSSEDECPCEGQCVYSALMGLDGLFFWSALDLSTCAAPCSCRQPSYEPTFFGEIALGSCWGPCESSESSAPSESSAWSESSAPSESSASPESSAQSESSATSESSVPVDCIGYCTWMANQYEEWQLFYNGCQNVLCSGCTNPPSEPPEYPYEVRQTSCEKT